MIWPEKYDPKTSAIYALNDIDVKPMKIRLACLWSASQRCRFGSEETMRRSLLRVLSTTPNDYPRPVQLLSAACWPKAVLDLKTDWSIYWR